MKNAKPVGGIQTQNPLMKDRNTTTLQKRLHLSTVLHEIFRLLFKLQFLLNSLAYIVKSIPAKINPELKETFESFETGLHAHH